MSGSIFYRAAVFCGLHPAAISVVFCFLCDFLHVSLQEARLASVAAWECDTQNSSAGVRYTRGLDGALLASACLCFLIRRSHEAAHPQQQQHHHHHRVLSVLPGKLLHSGNTASANELFFCLENVWNSQNCLSQLSGDLSDIFKTLICATNSLKPKTAFNLQP